MNLESLFISRGARSSARATATASLAFFAAVFALPAGAQQAAPAPASAVVVPPMSCDKPADTPLLNPSSSHIQRLQKQIETYKLCVNEYSRSMGAKSNEAADQARAYAAAANGAIDDYNTYVTALNERAKGGESSELKQGPSTGGKSKY